MYTLSSVIQSIDTAGVRSTSRQYTAVASHVLLTDDLS
jgi:hypothetical protein